MFFKLLTHFSLKAESCNFEIKPLNGNSSTKTQFVAKSKYLFHIWDRIIYIIEDFEQERGYGHLLISICQFKNFRSIIKYLILLFSLTLHIVQ